MNAAEHGRDRYAPQSQSFSFTPCEPEACRFHMALEARANTAGISDIAGCESGG